MFDKVLNTPLNLGDLPNLMHCKENMKIMDQGFLPVGKHTENLVTNWIITLSCLVIGQ